MNWVQTLDLSDRFSVALLFDQPYGADADYTKGPYTGLAADWESNSITFLGKYKATDNISIYAGPRVLRSSADIAIPPTIMSFATGGVVTTEYTAIGKDTGVGYVIGAAYEKKEIALRVGLTYQSKIDHEFATTETVEGGTFTTLTEVEMPQSVTLDFQSGIAADTLVFGSIKWTEWSKWSVAPPAFFSGEGVPGFSGTGVPIVSFENNTLVYSLGIGRKINENLALFGRIGYEEAKGGIASRLSPTDGKKSIGFGASYKVGKTKFTGGVEYVKLGNAIDGTDTVFDDNTAIAFGLSVGISF